MPALTSVSDVHAAEERLRASRANANEIVDLLDLLEVGAPRVKLAAMQSCRSLFSAWAANRTLVLSVASAAMSADLGDGGETAAAADTPLLAFRRWVLEQYRRFVALLRRMVQRSETPPGLRTPAMDSLVQMAALEVRYSRKGVCCTLTAFEAPAGAFGQLVAGLALCPRHPLLRHHLGSAT